MAKRVTDEDIEKGVAKVERMNALFDKMALPVLLAVVLAVFLFGALPKLIRCVGGDTATENTAQISSVSDMSRTDEENPLYAARNAYTSEMNKHRDEIEAKGYSFMDVFDDYDCILIHPNDTDTVYEFCNQGECYGRIKTTEFELFDEVSVTIKSSKHIDVSISLKDGEKIKASFGNESFIPTDGDEDKQMILAYLTSEELVKIKERYDSHLKTLLG